jgi:hypothetical protein
MAHATFKTHPFSLEELLRDCSSGKIQLPDFQRSWVWDEERIKGLIASISRAFPVGALMTLEIKGDKDKTFARRPIEGTDPAAADAIPLQLLLDGQQRMTSLYQTCLRKDVVQSITPNKRLVRHWYYFDIAKAVAPGTDREEAIVAVPEDRQIKTAFNRTVDMDLSARELEFEHMMFPVNCLFDKGEWFQEFMMHCFKTNDMARVELFNRFKAEVIDNFQNYQVPVITLGPDTSHEAVCLVFEKVNTGGKALDAFELVTAMYAAQGFRLRDDWLGTAAAAGAPAQPGIQNRLQVYGNIAGHKFGVLEKVASTDFLQAIALLHSRRQYLNAKAAGAKDNDLPAVRATKQSLLDLPLEAYKAYRAAAEAGFKTAARFLYQQGIYRAYDLPYQTQLVPLAAILAELGDAWEPAPVRAKLARWYWCGIFGELYGSAVESRFALDVMQVPEWIAGGTEPRTVRDGMIRAERLQSMRSRQSAAYKGVHALLMKEGARDFRTGQPYDQTVFFQEDVDIHHIFPQAWCASQTIEPRFYDSIINKTPLGARTNRIIGGQAPSKYLARIESGAANSPPISPDMVDAHLVSHGIDPALLRADDFTAFMVARETWLLGLIGRATGHAQPDGDAVAEEGEELPDALVADLDPPMAAG